MLVEPFLGLGKSVNRLRAERSAEQTVALVESRQKSRGHLHAAGAYFTVVNVHNPTDQQIALTKRLALVGVAEKAGPVSEAASAMLGPDQALAVDCPDLHQLSGGTQDFLEGYLLIDNPTHLNVVATYSAAGENGLVTTLDVQRIAPTTAVAHPAGTAR